MGKATDTKYQQTAKTRAEATRGDGRGCSMRCPHLQEDLSVLQRPRLVHNANEQGSVGHQNARLAAQCRQATVPQRVHGTPDEGVVEGNTHADGPRDALPPRLRTAVDRKRVKPKVNGMGIKVDLLVDSKTKSTIIIIRIRTTDLTLVG
jgi:hypothetical protein